MPAKNVELIPDDKSDTPKILGQRDRFFDELFPIFERDKDCVIITADNGAPALHKFAEKLPRQFIQVGIAEQQMFGMAAGMAFEGKRVYCYAIAPFVTTRVHEFIKLDICAMNMPVTLLGIGAGYAYDIMGPSHHTLEDISIMRCLPNLKIWSPADGVCAAALAGKTYRDASPHYIRFDRAGIPDLYEDEDFQYWRGCWIATRLVERPAVAIITTGVMVHQAIKVAEELAEEGIKADIFDIIRIKPFDTDVFPTIRTPIVTLEEHFLAGGLGSIVAESLADLRIELPLLRLGRTDEQGYCFIYGGRDEIWKQTGLDVDSVCSKIRAFLKK